MPAREHITGLDGLRALACLAVFGVHFQQITGYQGQFGIFDFERLLQNGNTGVALFFTLSGFLLSRPFWLGHIPVSGKPWIARYALRRIFRILPAYYLCLTVLIVHQSQWHSASERLDLLLHYLFLHNYREASFYSINEPFWTLAVQAQFYIVVAIVFVCAGRLQRSAGGALAFAILALVCFALHWCVMEKGDAVAARLGMPNLVTSHPSVFSRSVMAHLPHLFLGVMAGWVYSRLDSVRRAEPRNRFCEIAVWIALLGILVTLGTPVDDYLTIVHGRYNLPYIPLLIAVTVACVPFTSLARVCLEFAPLRWLGLVSFGMYVYHLPCMRFAANVLPRLGMSASENWLVFGLAGLVVSVLVSGLSYLLVERPLHSRTVDRQPN